MTTPAMNHAKNPLQGKTDVPTGNAQLLRWDQIESTLRVAGVVRPAESVQCFIVADDGVWLVTAPNR